MKNVQNTSFTKDTEKLITKSKIEYDRNTRFRPTMKAIIETEEKYHEYLETCRRELADLREQYCSGMLSFAFICLIHKKYETKDVNGDICEILGRNVHLCNKTKPSAVIDDDRIIYADILTTIAMNNLGNKKYKTWKKNFEKIMREQSTFLVLDIDNREKIVNACIALGWSSEDLDYLLLRMGDDGLQANSVQDMIIRFVLDLPEVVFDHYEELKGRCGELLAEKFAIDTNRDAGQTKVSYNHLAKIIQDTNISSLDERMNLYVEALHQNKIVYQGYSKTARNKLEHILLLTAHSLGWTVPEVDDYLADLTDPRRPVVEPVKADGKLNMKNIEFFDYAKVILECDIEPISEENRDRLVQAILSHYANTAEDIFGEEKIEFAPGVYDARLAFPSIGTTKTGGGYFKVPLTARLKELLSGEKPVKKHDILFALYLLCAKTQVIEKPYDFYRNFVTTANAVLAECNLPKWYSAHVLEYTIGKSIFGLRFEDIFVDITEVYQLLQPKRKKHAEKKDDSNKEEEEQEKFEQFKDAFKKLTDYVEVRTKRISSYTTLNLPQLSEEKVVAEGVLFTRIFRKNRTIYTDLLKIAKEIDSLWNQTGYDKMDVAFNDQSNCVVAYPGGIKSNNQPYVLQNKLSDELFAIMHEYDENLMDAHGSVKNNVLLRAFYIPEKDGSVRSLDDYASRYFHKKEESITMSDVFASNPNINRRFRRNIVLSIIIGMIFNEEKIPDGVFETGNKPQVLVTADPKLKLPYLDWVYVNKRLRENIGKAEETTKEEESGSEAEIELTEEEQAFLTHLEAMEPVGKMLSEIPEGSRYEQCSRLVKEMNKYEPLTADLNSQLVTIVLKRSQRAKDLMITHNMRLVLDAINKFFSGKEKPSVNLLEDLLMEGNLALIEAVEKFNPNFGWTFSTYAVPVIQNRLKGVLASESNVVYVPKQRSAIIHNVSKEFAKFYKDNGRTPKVEELAKSLGYSEDAVIEALVLLQKSESQDEYIGDEESTTKGELIEDLTVDVAEEAKNKMLRSAINKVLSTFTLREQQIYHMRYGQLKADLTDERPDEDRFLDPEGYTWKEISQILHISIEQVIRTEVDIRRKLSHPRYVEEIEKYYK